MILLQLLVGGRERLVVQEVMGQVVADIAKDASAKHRSGYIPVPVKDGVRKVVKWCCEEDK